MKEKPKLIKGVDFTEIGKVTETRESVKIDLKQVERETIKQIRAIINTYDGLNYDVIERAVKQRLEVSREMILFETKDERTRESKQFFEKLR